MISSGKNVVLLGQVPNPNIEPAELAGMAHVRGRDPEAIGTQVSVFRDKFDNWGEVERDLANRTLVELFDPAPSLCDADFCPIVDRGELLYFNSTHVSMAGASRIANGLYPLLQDRQGSAGGGLLLPVIE